MKNIGFFGLGQNSFAGCTGQYPLIRKLTLGATLIILYTKFWLFIRLRILLSTVFSKLPSSTIKMAAKRLVRWAILICSGSMMAVRAINWLYLF